MTNATVTRAILLVAGCIVLGAPVSTSVAFQAAPPLATDLSPPPDFRPYCYRPPVMGAVSMMLPERLRPKTIQWYSRILGLSEDQWVAFISLCEAHAQADLDLRKKYETPLWEKSAEILDAGGPSRSPDLAEEWVALQPKITAHARRIARLDAQLFTELELMLSDDQLTRLPLVQNHRKRQHANSDHCGVHGGDTDLHTVLLEMESQGWDIEPLEPDLFETWLLEYDGLITPLFTARHRNASKAVGRSSLINARLRQAIEMVEAGSSPTAEILALRAEMVPLQRRHVRSAKRIQEHNLRYATDLAQALPYPSSRELISRVNRISFPAVYPDATDLHEVLMAAEEMATSDESREQVFTVKMDLESRREIIIGKMRVRSSRWREDTLTRLEYRFDELDEYVSEMKKLDKARVNLAMQTVSLLHGILMPDPGSPLGRAIAGYEAEIIETTEKRAKDEADPRQTGWPYHNR